jgi:hypothetical protein
VADTLVIRGRLRGRVAPGIDLEHTIAPDGDPDHLLTDPECRIVKIQKKVIVGRADTTAGPLYVKRYNVFAWRLAVASLFRPSPAFAAWTAARALEARGFGTPALVAAVEVRRAGLLTRSFFVTREVPDAVTADVRWRTILADPHGPRRRVARRALARALGDLFRRLHATGPYHNDLKDVNVLIAGTPEAPRCVLLDLERVRVIDRVGRRRRLKNLVQLARTLGRAASASDRARFLAAYLGDGASRAERRALARAVIARAARKDRGKAIPTATDAPLPTVSCTIVCQNEETHLERCLETVRWCDEIVVVDGGSRDRTATVAREFTDRLIHSPWPGYRAQKQFALDAARGEWVLNLDADERVTPELASEIRGMLGTVTGAAPGPAQADALGRDRSARAGGGRRSNPLPPLADPPLHVRRRVGPSPEPQQADGDRGRAAEDPRLDRRRPARG